MIKRFFSAKDSDLQPEPLARAYSHSDSDKKRPLLDALSNGFCSFEADVWLIGGKLLVGHDPQNLSFKNTLEELYLKPLLEQVRQNNGRVYPSWPHSVQLFIDVKIAPEGTYKAVHELLEKYKKILTTFSNNAISESAVTVIISGGRSRELMESQKVRYAGYDGRLHDLGKGAPASLMPVISDDWGDHFKWRGIGKMPEKERQKLQDIVKKAHANNHRCRFWSTPDNYPFARGAVWKELVAAGVDYIGTDHLVALRDWLQSKDPQLSPENYPLKKSGVLGKIGHLRRQWGRQAKKIVKIPFKKSGNAINHLKNKFSLHNKKRPHLRKDSGDKPKNKP